MCTPCMDWFHAQHCHGNKSVGCCLANGNQAVRALVPGANLWYKLKAMEKSEHKKMLHGLEKTLGYSFRRPDLLARALIHRSWAVEHKAAADNERLEFLGDAVLELATSDLIYRRYADKCSEGDMTRMRASLVNENQLAEVAARLGLGEYIRLGRGERNSGGSRKPSLLSDALEAVIGAIYLDGGFQPALEFVEQILGELLRKAPRGLQRDCKSRLQELVQARMHITPTYQVEDVSGPAHSRFFNVSLLLKGEVLSRGSGSSKKEAEQQAACKALEKLEQVKA